MFSEVAGLRNDALYRILKFMAVQYVVTLWKDLPYATIPICIKRDKALVYREENSQALRQRFFL